MSDKELKTEIALTVMNWNSLEGRWWRKEWPREHNTWTFDQVPDYPTDISAAMEVVEKMRERGQYVVINADGKQNWIVWFRDNDLSFHGESLPRAICEAALAALSPL